LGVEFGFDKSHPGQILTTSGLQEGHRFRIQQGLPQRSWEVEIEGAQIAQDVLAEQAACFDEVIELLEKFRAAVAD